MRKQKKWLVLAGLILVFSGCRSVLNVDSDFELKVNEPEKSFIVEPVKREQKVKVSVTTDAPVNVYVYLKADEQTARNDIFAKKKSEKVLGVGENIDGSGSVEATVAANSEAVVLIRLASAKPAKVKLNISN